MIKGTDSTKWCPGCQVFKSTDSFSRNNALVDGYSYSCRACQSVYKRQCRKLLRARSDEEIEAETAKRPPRPCRTCKEVKPLSDYPRDRGRRDGRGTLCLKCSAAATRYYEKVVGVDVVRQRRTASYKKNYEKTTRKYKLFKEFGITLEQYNSMLDAQGDVCAICGEPERQAKREGRLSVDHDHASGAIRQLLCSNCNYGLGHFRDSPELLTRAAEYLVKHHALQAQAKAT